MSKDKVYLVHNGSPYFNDQLLMIN